MATAQLSGCQKHSGTHQEQEHPANVERIDGSEFSRVTLTASAMQRLNVKTAKVSEERSRRSESQQKAVPYGAVLYDPHGKTWVYTSPQPGTFVRHQIEVDYIEGDVAYLSDGPPTGTEVATVGAAELYGTEFKVGH
jgi:hypothetical protein